LSATGNYERRLGSSEMIDYHSLKQQTKTLLLRRWQQMDVADDSLVWAWTVRALGAEGLENNPLLKQALEQARRWLNSDEVWKRDSQLASAGILSALFRQAGDEGSVQIAPRVVERIEQLRAKEVGKFSLLNNPDIVFGIAVGFADAFPDELRKWLAEHCQRSAQTNNWPRCMSFSAASYELKGTISSLAVKGSDLQAYEVIPALWFAERYPKLLDSDDRRRSFWEAFERIKEGISWEDNNGENAALYAPSPVDTAMFYEALLCRTGEIDAVALFKNLPLHPEVRQAAESLFIKGEYVNAVFEAMKTFIEKVKNRAGNPVNSSGMALDGVVLLENVFSRQGSRVPPLKFTDLNNLAEEDEHDGLYFIARGIQKAFRNPAGHLPRTSIPLSPGEALEKLATISYMMKRLDSAHP
jgi:uncharacterized protein (TIGR02391 family)